MCVDRVSTGFYTRWLLSGWPAMTAMWSRMTSSMGHSGSWKGNLMTSSLLQSGRNLLASFRYCACSQLMALCRWPKGCWTKWQCSTAVENYEMFLGIGVYTVVWSSFVVVIAVCSALGLNFFIFNLHCFVWTEDHVTVNKWSLLTLKWQGDCELVTVWRQVTICLLTCCCVQQVTMWPLTDDCVATNEYMTASFLLFH